MKRIVKEYRQFRLVDYPIKLSSLLGKTQFPIRVVVVFILGTEVNALL